MLFAGVLLPLKGVYLAIRALERLSEWRLIICGSGSDERRLQRLVSRRNLVNRVEFRGWVERPELARVMQEEADVFVFPSLRDQAGFVVAEATAYGLPTVCLDRGGPKVLGGIPVKSGSPQTTADALAAAIAQARDTRPSTLPDRPQQLLRLRQLLEDRGLLHAAPSAVPGQGGPVSGSVP
jgi:glycosyltransferase involved in cell wall biosynthesis